MILCALASNVPGPASGGWLSLWDPPDPATLPASSVAPRAERAPPRVRNRPGSGRQMSEAVPTGSHPSVLGSVGVQDFLTGVSLHSSGSCFPAAGAAMRASLRRERSSDGAGRILRDSASHPLLWVTLLESKLARTLSGTAPGRRSTGVRCRASQLGGAGGPGPHRLCISCLPLPLPPSVEGTGRRMGSRSFFLRPGLTLPAPPGLPAGLRRASGERPGSCLAATCVAACFWRVRSSRLGHMRARDVGDPRLCA